jgi:hypothetical protein
VDEGLLFWLIIIAVAVLQGIGQKKKKPGQPGPKQPQGPPGPSPIPPAERKRVTASSRPTPSSAGGGRQGIEEAGSSESMIPSEIWEEILGLARGEPRRAEPAPPPPPETETPWALEERPRKGRPAAAVARRRDPAVVPEERSFPTSHGADGALHATRPADFKARLALSRTSTPEAEEEEAKPPELRTVLFGSGSSKELRRAIILKEVLGPPMALRE